MTQVSPDREQLLKDSTCRVWKLLLRQLKAEIAGWNCQFLPTDGRRIVLDEVEDRILALTSRTAAVTATMSVDGREIAVVARCNSDIGHSWRDSVQLDGNGSRTIELRRGEKRLSPEELAYLLVERAAQPFAEEVA